MPPSVLPQDHRHTWTEYRTWPDDERWEIIDGVAYNMSPAPSTRHQAIVGNLFAYLHRHLAGKGCRPLMAPTDVRLSETNVVQPDILVVCDPAPIMASHIEGAPDLVCEGIMLPFPTGSGKGKTHSPLCVSVGEAGRSDSVGGNGLKSQVRFQIGE